VSDLRRFVLSHRPIRYWPLDEAPVAGGLPAAWRDRALRSDLTNSQMEVGDLRATGQVGGVHLVGPEGGGRSTYFDTSDGLSHATPGLIASLGGDGGGATYLGFCIVAFFTYWSGTRWDALYAERKDGSAPNLLKIEMQDTGGPIGLSMINNAGTAVSVAATGVQVGDNRLHVCGFERRNVNGEQRAYLDGRLVATNTQSWGSWDAASMTSRVGHDPHDYPNSTWPGIIAHVAIFDRPLGAAFHRRLWEIGLRGLTAHPSARRRTG